MLAEALTDKCHHCWGTLVGPKGYCDKCTKKAAYQLIYELEKAGQISEAAEVLTDFYHERVTVGLCAQCGSVREHYKWLCDTHTIQNRKTVRRRNGHLPQPVAGCGRKALVPDNGLDDDNYDVQQI